MRTSAMLGIEALLLSVFAAALVVRVPTRLATESQRLAFVLLLLVFSIGAIAIGWMRVYRGLTTP